MCGRRGQASLEYLAVMGLVAAIIAGAAAPALGGPDLAGGVVRQIRRALCRVRGGDCEQDRRPCVLAARRLDRERSLSLAVVKLRSRAAVLRERRSDGLVAVTWVRQRAGGLGLGLGAGGHLSIGGKRLGAGTELDADVLAVAGAGTTWIVAPSVADRLVARLERAAGGGPLGLGSPPDLRGLPRPVRRSDDHGLEVALGARAQRGQAAGQLRLTSADVAGAVVDRASGRRTLLVRRRTELAGRLVIGGAAAGGLSGTWGGDAQFALTVDRSGRPVDLAILSGGDAAAAVRLGLGGAGRLSSLLAGGAGRRWEREQHLDLTEPENLAAARAALGQVVSPRPHLGELVRVGAALRRRLATDGVEDVRVYTLSDRSGGFDASGEARGIRLGMSSTTAERRTRLLGAEQRGPEGVWRSRTDCVGGL